MFVKLALRDALIVLGTALAWWKVAPISAESGALGDFVGFVVGIASGISVYLLHEWGHALGGLAAGSVIHPARSLAGISLFSFDSRKNGRREFAAMSLAGFAVTAVAIAFVYTVLPDGWLASRVARGATLALASLTVFLEVPIFVIGLVRNELPPVETFDPKPPAPSPPADLRPPETS